MAWNHDDVAPNRSRDELLGEVVRRGERKRRFRRVAAGLGGSVTLLLVIAGVAVLAGTGGDEPTNLAAGGRSTTTVAVTRPATGGALFAVVAPSTSVAADAPVEVAPSPTTTALRPGSEPTGPVPTTTPPEPTIPPPAQPRCSPAVTQATLALAPTYHQGERISGQAVLRNTSGATCWYYSYSTQQGFKDGNGNPVAGLGSFIADAFTDTPFAPGQTLTLAPEWDQQVCTAAPACGPASPGTYSATVSWSFDGPPVEVTTTFQIVP